MSLAQGHTDLYRSSPALPEVERPAHLMPSACIKTKEYRPVLDLGPNDLTKSDDDLTLAELQEKSSQGTSQVEQSLPGGGSLASHPKGPRVSRKHKVIVEPLDDDAESR